MGNIYGVDLNTSATKIARINLWLRNGQNANSLKILERNIKVGNSIVENKLVGTHLFSPTKSSLKCPVLSQSERFFCCSPL